MFYLSFHGGSGSSSLNNIHIYNDDGSEANPSKLLPQGTPSLSELRGFAFTNGLMVVNGYQKYSQLLQYTATGTPPTYQYAQTWASPAINSVAHPFDFTFDANGKCYLSSQDTGVVTILTAAGKTGNVPAALTQNGVPASSYLQGTFVASVSHDLPNIPVNASVAVAEPLGLAVDVESGKMANSVRGLAYWNGALLVADEVAGMVKAYSVADGSLLAAATGLDSPVHLLINDSTLYISTKQGVMQVTLQSQISFTTPLNATAYITPQMISAAKAKSVAGMCFGPEPGSSGNQVMFVADREGNAVYYFNGKSLRPFIPTVTDSPEFVVYQS